MHELGKPVFTSVCCLKLSYQFYPAQLVMEDDDLSEWEQIEREGLIPDLPPSNNTRTSDAHLRYFTKKFFLARDKLLQKTAWVSGF